MKVNQIKDIMRLIADNEGIESDFTELNEDFNDVCENICDYVNYRESNGKKMSGSDVMDLCAKELKKHRKNAESLNEQLLTEADDGEEQPEEEPESNPMQDTLTGVLTDETSADEPEDNANVDEPADEESKEESADEEQQPEEEPKEEEKKATPEEIDNSISSFAGSILAEATSMVKGIESFKLTASEFDANMEEIMKVFDLVTSDLNHAIGALRAVNEKYGNSEGIEEGQSDAEKILGTTALNVEKGEKAIEVIAPIDGEDKEKDESKKEEKDDKKEESFKYNYSLEGLNENLDREEDVLDAFMSIMDEEYPYVGKAIKRINESYRQHRDDPIYKSAYKKWKNTDDVQIYLSEKEQ